MADPVRIGPTDSPRPERTLAVRIFPWVSEWLRQPDGPTAGDPWKFTAEQARFVAWWYAIDDLGRFLYRRAVLRRVKGWGKDPVLAVIAAVELEGPCRFGGFDDDGMPVAIRHPMPWIQVAAVSKDQTRNTMTLFPGLFSDDALIAFGLDIGKEIIHTRRRGRIEAVTSSPAALEGGRPSLVIKNETQHWLPNNDGHAMSQAIDRNLAKSRDGSARAIAITNAHEPGLDSDAERDWEAWTAIETGQSKATGFLYDSVEAPADTDLADEESLRAGLEAARGDSWWLDIDRLVAEVWDPKTPPSMSRRFYLNQIWAAEDSWVTRQEWDSLNVLPEPEDGSIITLGFDGSITDDWCVLIGCDVDRDQVFTIGIWNPELYGGGAPRELIDGEVRRAFERWDVVGFYSDLHPWESYVDSWAEDLARGKRGPRFEGLSVKAGPRHPIAWDMRGRGRDATVAAERLHAAIVDGVLSHDGNKLLAQHVYNARRRPNQYGVTFGKEHRESAKKVDAVSAAMLARLARLDYLALPANRRRRRKAKASFL